MNATNMSGPPIQVPERRLLKTYAFDPTSTRLSGQYLTVNIAFEPNLKPGPAGELLQVIDYDPVRQKYYSLVDLNDPLILVQDGLDPTEGDPRTHQQVVYAVGMSVIERFERHLGRRFRFRADKQLYLVPHAFEGSNAFFDPGRRAILFGYFKASPKADLPGQTIFTCLSSDIIAHEMAHALVHRLRPRLVESTNSDVFAIHEGFADLVALFQHFAYRDVVFQALTEASGQIDSGGVLFELASEFGVSTGRGGALRKAIDPKQREVHQRPAELFKAATEPHERGACFVAAVFDAFVDRFKLTTADLVRIASSGTGELPPGRLHPDLVGRVTDEAVRTADRLLGMVVASLDYLPYADVTFGDVLRAIVTADYAINPEDTDGMRAALVEALRKRGIYPARVANLTDHGLRWPEPRNELNLNGSYHAAEAVFRGVVEHYPVDEEVPDKVRERSGKAWDRIWESTWEALLQTSVKAGRPSNLKTIYTALARGLDKTDAIVSSSLDKELRSKAFADRLYQTFLDEGGAPAPLGALVYSATMDLDLKGDAGHDPEMYAGLHAWACAHVVDLGLDPKRTIAIGGVHAAYRIANDRQPLPEIVIQLYQNASDLRPTVSKELGVDDVKVALFAGTTLIVRPGGLVKYVIAKPLPFTSEPAAEDRVATAFHRQGIERLQSMIEYFKNLDRSDSLGLWDDRPAVERLDFARLHFAQSLADGS
ncbi:MAG: hypothetical protein JST91_27365 [Actinobacteria bacterium]|nr:hypothetical protein [Actinomycetota bacterium]